VAARLRPTAGQLAIKRWPRLLSTRLGAAVIALLAGAGAGAALDNVLVTPGATQQTTFPSYGVAKSLTPGRTVEFRSSPRTTSAIVTRLPDGTPVPIVCTSHGDQISGNWGKTDLWDRILYRHLSGWVSDGLLYTGTNAAVAPRC
jgi:LasA protease